MEEVRKTSPALPEKRGRGRPRHQEPSREYLARQSDIIDVAVKVFREKGYDAGSLDEIAAALDLRKATLYYYVRSKAELLYLIFDRAITEGLDRLDTIAYLGSGVDIIETLIEHQVHGIANNPELFAVFFDHRPRLSPKYEASIRAKEQRYLQLFSDLLVKAMQDGSVADVDPRYAAHALIGMTSWLYKWFDPARDDAEAFAETATALVRKGIRPLRSEESATRSRSVSRKRALQKEQ